MNKPPIATAEYQAGPGFAGWYGTVLFAGVLFGACMGHSHTTREGAVTCAEKHIAAVEARGGWAAELRELRARDGAVTAATGASHHRAHLG